MLAGYVNHAASLLATYAREAKFRLRREDYARPCKRYGRIAVLGYFGDHLQLPPVPKKNSMLAPLDGTSQEHRVGAAIFRQVRYVFHLQQMMRFKDPVLIRILRSMRTVGGQHLADIDWKAFMAHSWLLSLTTTLPVLKSLMSWLVTLRLERHLYGCFGGGTGICAHS